MTQEEFNTQVSIINQLNVDLIDIKNKMETMAKNKNIEIDYGIDDMSTLLDKFDTDLQKVEGTLNIKENGIFDVSAYKNVNVNTTAYDPNATLNSKGLYYHSMTLQQIQLEGTYQGISATTEVQGQIMAYTKNPNAYTTFGEFIRDINEADVYFTGESYTIIMEALGTTIDATIYLEKIVNYIVSGTAANPDLTFTGTVTDDSLIDDNVMLNDHVFNLYP